MSVTQHDVAALAGVSRKTVSNVINGYPHISTEVKERVQAAIDQLGYRPNHVARSLRSGRSRVVGLVIPELDVSYFAELARLIVMEANDRDLTVMIMQTLNDRTREIRAISGDSAPFVEGIICSPVALSSVEIHALRGDSPLVLLGEHPSQGVLDHVGIDNVSAAREATEHLLSLGCRRIAFLGASDYPGWDDIAHLRTTGYLQAMSAAGVKPIAGHIRQIGGFHRRHGLETMRALLGGKSHRIDAVFCANDLLAQGAMRALHEAGLTVPENVAVVGFDDTSEGRYSVPTLTSVSPNKQEIALAAVSRIAELIEGRSSPVTDVVTSHRLRIGESSTGWHSSSRPRQGNHRPPRADKLPVSAKG